MPTQKSVATRLVDRENWSKKKFLQKENQTNTLSQKVLLD